MSKIAVVLFNLGGPDSPEAVRPFLYNLFNDPAIIDWPQPFRSLLARLIARKRAGNAKGIYQQMGGKSPLFDLTTAQAEALEQKLRYSNKVKEDEYKVFVSMRYWHPMSSMVVKKVKAYEPNKIILLPLYPQYSTTTTGSSLSDWDASAKKEGLDVPTSKLCCYPTDFGFVAAHVRLIRDAYWKAAEDGKPRILFSAHGLPEKVVKAGDPYQWQIEKTVKSIVQVLTIEGLDYTVCYQSRVGPMRWIGPTTDEEIIQAGKDQVPVLVVPVSFVSEHSETLVELDIDFRRLAMANNVPGYYRVPALGTEPLFIETLADMCLNPPEESQACSSTKSRVCPDYIGKCPCKLEAEQAPLEQAA